MTTSEDRVLDGIQAVLPALDLKILSPTVLNKMQAPSRTKYAPHFEKRACDIWDRAKGERAYD